MDEQLVKRIVGLLTLGLIALVLSWLLPRPGLESLSGDAEQIISIDLVEPDLTREQDLIAMSTPGQGNENKDAAIKAEQAEVEPVPAAPQSPDTASSEPQPSGSKPASPAPIAPPPQEPKSRAAAPEPAKPAPVKKPPVKKESVASKPAPTPPEPKKSTPASPEPKKSTASTPDQTRYLVQAGAFSQIDSARAMQARCNLQGLECKLLPTESSKGTLYRVRCGPYLGRAQAEGARSRLAKAGIKSSLVAAGG